MVVIVASAGVGFAQGAQSLSRRHALRRPEYHHSNIHPADGLFAIDAKSQKARTIKRRVRGRKADNLVTHHGLARRIRIHELTICANQASDLEMAKRTQLIKGSALHLVKRLRQGL
jgi:hypothetical protein